MAKVTKKILFFWDTLPEAVITNSNAGSQALDVGEDQIHEKIRIRQHVQGKD